ncbi:YbjQ family protein [Alkaliphilus serpentinus]|uniref:UPF0145 protein F8153_04780 n=1 Tax=Alkaliphilus serpentinus TaxID=1482731 RepID=A0A833HQ95_9FIRM|nr:YbjQ family protein [Alkaliphilus serpentinus]KAB3531495.1 YbjQ family protein [Alkaliphilus serpentinus]
MIVINTSEIPGREVSEVIGIVKGSTIKAKHIGKDIMAVLRHIVGGELTEYTEMLNEARDTAMELMIKEATSLRADAILNVRFATSAVMQGAAEILVYGTAVKLK